MADITAPEMEALMTRVMGSFFGSGGSPPPSTRTTTTTPAIPGTTTTGVLTDIIPPELQSNVDDFRDRLKGAYERAEQLKRGVQAIDEAALEAIEPLRAVSQSIQETYGGFRSANEKMNIEMSQNMRDSYDDFASTMTMNTEQLRAAGKERFVVEVDGKEVNMLKDVFVDSMEVMTRYEDMVDAYNTTYGPAFSKGLKNNTADVAYMQKNFNLTADQLGNFLAKEVAQTGEATTTMMDDLKTFSYGLSAQTGISAKLIAKDTVEIVSNVERFGNVTVEEAARMSTALKQLGVDYGQLNNMVGVFQGFDQAATKVGELSAVFGIHLDAVEMMNLANTDQEAMMHKLRDAFDESGQSLDDMNIAQKNLLTEQAGFTDVKQMEMFFSGQVDSMEELKDMTDEAATDEGAADAMEAFNKDLATLSLQGLTAAERIDKAKKDMVYSFNSMAPAIMEGRGALMAAGAGLNDEFQAVVTKIPEAIVKVTETVKEVSQGDGSVGDIGTSIAKGITDSLDMIPGAAERTFDGIIGIAKDLGLLAESPSDFGELISGGIIHALDKVPPHFEKIISKVAGSAGEISELIDATGLQDMTEKMDDAGIIANANITTLLTEYQNKISEVQGLVEAPEKIVEILNSVAEMKGAVEILLKGLQEENAKPIKLVFDSRGGAEKALVGILKDYVGDDTGRVAFEYEGKSL